MLRPTELLAFRWNNQPAERRWAARRRISPPEIPLDDLEATLVDNTMELAGTHAGWERRPRSPGRSAVAIRSRRQPHGRDECPAEGSRLNPGPHAEYWLLAP